MSVRVHQNKTVRLIAGGIMIDCESGTCSFAFVTIDNEFHSIAIEELRELYQELPLFLEKVEEMQKEEENENDNL